MLRCQHTLSKLCQGGLFSSPTLCLSAYFSPDIFTCGAFMPSFKGAFFHKYFYQMQLYKETVVVILECFGKLRCHESQVFPISSHFCTEYELIQWKVSSHKLRKSKAHYRILKLNLVGHRAFALWFNPFFPFTIHFLYFLHNSFGYHRQTCKSRCFSTLFFKHLD